MLIIQVALSLSTLTGIIQLVVYLRRNYDRDVMTSNQKVLKDNLEAATEENARLQGILTSLMRRAEQGGK
jgi:hypothetical protein